MSDTGSERETGKQFLEIEIVCLFYKKMAKLNVSKAAKNINFVKLGFIIFNCYI